MQANSGESALEVASRQQGIGKGWDKSEREKEKDAVSSQLKIIIMCICIPEMDFLLE